LAIGSLKEGAVVEKMLQPEIDAATCEILNYLESHGDAPVMAVRSALGRPELYFYMGLGNLILTHRVAIQEREEVFWTVHIPPAAKAA
jgi:hypothetical protein